MLYLIVLISIVVVNCTIDMNIAEFEYLADHLTLEDCRKLVAALHFVSYELPAALSAAERKVPDDVSCLTLLINWNSGREKWEGRGKTHEEIEHRLRQIGNTELADWLGRTVFHQLAKDINESLLNIPFGKYNVTSSTIKTKMYVEKLPPSQEEEWTLYDSILWVFLVLMLLTILWVCYEIIHLTCKKMYRPKKGKSYELDNLIENEEMYGNSRKKCCGKKHKEEILEQGESETLSIGENRI